MDGTESHSLNGAILAALAYGYIIKFMNIPVCASGVLPAVHVIDIEHGAFYKDVIQQLDSDIDVAKTIERGILRLRGGR